MLKKSFVFFIGVLSSIYIINPGSGALEILPDFIPFVGNLDEGVAVVLLVSVLRYFGIDFTTFFSKNKTKS